MSGVRGAQKKTFSGGDSIICIQEHMTESRDMNEGWEWKEVCVFW